MVIVGIGVTIFLFGFAAGLFLGAAVGSGKAQDSYDAGYAAGVRAADPLTTLERMQQQRHLHDIERLYAAETDE